MFAKHDLDVDEAIIKFARDTSLLKQYMSLMPTKKVWIVAGSALAEVIEIYAGKKSSTE